MRYRLKRLGEVMNALVARGPAVSASFDIGCSGHLAHVMADQFDNVHEGCGFDDACNYIP